MPIEPKRIEAAARALMSDWGSIDAPTEQELEYAFDKAKAVLAAGFPELASDPPTAWVAPIKSTLAVDGAIWMALNAEGADPMQAARDAYTKEQT